MSKTLVKRSLLSLLILLIAFAGGPRLRTTAQDEGKMLADTGFRAETNGFPFENYGNDQVQNNLTAADMQRMFGDAVCARAGTPCTLTPPAKEWMDQTNQAMDGGHCEGMAALSTVFYTRKEDVSNFGGPSILDLSLDSNTKLQEEIAYYWSTQATDPTVSSTIADKTPSEIVDILIDAMKDGPNSTEFYTIGIYQTGFKNGHAITPYAVVDKGNGIVWIMVYDNNYPKVDRYIEVDRNANTWQYQASTNPSEPESLYQGDAESKTLQLTPLTPRLQKQVCPFCGDVTTGRVGGLADTTPAYNQIWLTTQDKKSDANLLIVDSQGHRLGYDGDKFYEEIPGAHFAPMKSADLFTDDPEPVYMVPVGVAFKVVLDGSQMKAKSSVDVSLIGPGYDLSAEEIMLDPGQKDELTFSPDGKTISYKTSQSESPTLVLGIEHKGADYEFDIKGADIEENGVITAHLDYDKGLLTLKSENVKTTTTYSLDFYRIDDTSEQEFTHDGVDLNAGDTASLDFGKWEGNGKPLTLGIDKGSTGTITSTITLEDASQ